MERGGDPEDDKERQTEKKPCFPANRKCQLTHARSSPAAALPDSVAQVGDVMPVFEWARSRPPSNRPLLLGRVRACGGLPAQPVISPSTFGWGTVFAFQDVQKRYSAAIRFSAIEDAWKRFPSLGPPGSPARAFSRASSSLIKHDAGCQGGYR
ncbi:hypothetical protein ES708_00490 [subsurface metagenome]